MDARWQTENIILEMADIVRENRAMRRYIKELEKQNEEMRTELRESNNASEAFNKKLLEYAIITNNQRLEANTRLCCRKEMV